MCGRNGGEFGCNVCAEAIFGPKHGWVECKSRSFPGKVYYFHTGTRCSTWKRPVSRNIHVPVYDKFQKLNFAESSNNDDPELVTSASSDLLTKSSIYEYNTLPSQFELHTRRMEMYFKKNDGSCATGINEKFNVRDELYKRYKAAKLELQSVKRNTKPRSNKKAKKSDDNIITGVQPKKKIIVPTKIIRESHGIKTISYDPVPAELPPGVKVKNLSDTTIDSFCFTHNGLERSSAPDEKTARSQAHSVSVSDKRRGFGHLPFNDLNLSDSENTVNDSGFI